MSGQKSINKLPDSINDTFITNFFQCLYKFTFVPMLKVLLFTSYAHFTLNCNIFRYFCFILSQKKRALRLIVCRNIRKVCENYIQKVHNQFNSSQNIDDKVTCHDIIIKVSKFVYLSHNNFKYCKLATYFLSSQTNNYI